MSDNEVVPVPEAPPSTPAAAPRSISADQPVVRNPLRAWLITLTVVVAIQTVLLLGIIIAGVMVYSSTFFGMGMGEEYTQAETIAMDVGYYLMSGDVEGYMALYPADDPHVDRAQVQEDFEKVAASVATDTAGDFTPDSIVTYKDESTGEQVARITVSAYDYETGRPVGKRLTFWALLGDEPGTVLTGNKDRDLGSGKSVW